jgi:DNA-binding transcriptional MerR regulator
MNISSSGDTLVTQREAAEILGVSVRTVARLQEDGTLTPVYLTPIRRAKIRRYSRSQVEALRDEAMRQAS